MNIETGSTLLMIGDSITDCGRARPVGAAPRGLGTGYVALVDALLTAVHPERRVRVLNLGVSGDRVRDLKARWVEDVLAREADWLSVMIGVNDIWRKFDRPTQPDLHVPIDEYEATYDELLAETRATLKGLVLMTPFFVEPNRDEPMRAMVDAYGAVVRRLAERHDAVLVDVQAEFDRCTESLHPCVLAADRVHPVPAGHTIIARAFLKAVGFEW